MTVDDDVDDDVDVALLSFSTLFINKWIERKKDINK